MPRDPVVGGMAAKKGALAMVAAEIATPLPNYERHIQRHVVTNGAGDVPECGSLKPEE